MTDLDGLIPAAELAGMRGRLVGNWPATHDAAALWDAWHADFLAILAHAEAAHALVRELYGVVSDMHADDPGRQALLGRGGAEMLARVLAVMRDAFGEPSDADYPELAATLKVLRALGPSRPPLPPSEAEREAERLREALRGLVAAAGKVRATLGPNTAAWFEGLAGAYDAARRALGENAR